MGWKFQKRIRLLPGITFNLSRKGVSTSIGTTGARVTVGHGKTRVTTGIPGSGISHTSVYSNRPQGISQPDNDPQADNAAMDSRAIKFIGWAAAIVLIVLFLVSSSSMLKNSLFHWLILIAIGYGLFRALSPSQSRSQFFCITCGHQGVATTKTKGSILIEVILWLMFIIPGLIYSIWRHSSRQKACTQCGSTELVPPNSPVALATKKRLAE